MQRQCYLVKVGQTTEPHKRAKRPVVVKHFTHFNKSRPGRKIREKQA
jgi:hypothetical protein